MCTQTFFLFLCPVLSYCICVSHLPFLHIKSLLSQHMYQSKRQGNAEGSRKHFLLGVTGFHSQLYLFVLENILCWEGMFLGSGQSNETLEKRQAWPSFACTQDSLNKPSRFPTWFRKNEGWIETNPEELIEKQVKVMTVPFLLPFGFSSFSGFLFVYVFCANTVEFMHCLNNTR